MKRFLLFCGKKWYPRGGMADFVDSFDNIEDAYRAYDPPEKKYKPWAHIMDMQTMQIVDEFGPFGIRDVVVTGVKTFEHRHCWISDPGVRKDLIELHAQFEISYPEEDVEALTDKQVAVIESLPMDKV